MVNGGDIILAFKECFFLQRAGGTVRTVRHVEDDGVGVELRRGVAIHRSGGVVFEGCSNEPSCRLSGIVAADPRLGEPLQLGQCNAHGVAVGLSNSLIPAHQSGQGN